VPFGQGFGEMAAAYDERMLRSIVKQLLAPRIPIEPPRPPTFNEALAWASKGRSSRRARGSRNVFPGSPDEPNNDSTFDRPLSY
jgi:hypothetical protein